MTKERIRVTRTDHIYKKGDNEGQEILVEVFFKTGHHFEVDVSQHGDLLVTEEDEAGDQISYRGFCCSIWDEFIVEDFEE